VSFEVTAETGPVTFSGDNNPASPRRDLETLFAAEPDPVRRYYSDIQPVLKSAAAEGVNPAQPTGIYNHPPLSIVFFVEKVDQLECGASVKISSWPYMQVAFTLSMFNGKVNAHGISSFALI
jgi:hypothetical protein